MIIPTRVIAGNLVRDPEIKYFDSGRSLCEFSLAVSCWDTTKPTLPAKDHPTEFYKCTLWGEAGNNLAEVVRKPAKLIVTGNYSERHYTTQDGVSKVDKQINVMDWKPALDQPLNSTLAAPKPAPALDALFDDNTEIPF